MERRNLIKTALSLRRNSCYIPLQHVRLLGFYHLRALRNVTNARDTGVQNENNTRGKKSLVTSHVEQKREDSNT